MEYVFYVLIVVLGIVILSMINENRIKKARLSQLKRDWGTVPQTDFTYEEFESLRTYYDSIRDDSMDVDDITWNDLDLDQIYLLMSNTQSSIGDEYLYALLRKPCFSSEELKERNRLMKFFEENEEMRIKLQSKLFPIGKLSGISVFDYIRRLDKQESKSNIPNYLMVLSLLVSIGIIFVNPPVGGVLTVLSVGNNIYQYYMQKAKIENYLTVFAYICRMLDGVDEIHKLDIPEIKRYTDRLKEDCNSFKGFRRGASMVTLKNATGGVEDAILDYFRMLFHIDLIKFNSMLSFFKKHREVLTRIFVHVGYLDSMLAAASFRKLLPYYCEPQLENEKKVGLAANDLFHPLIADSVPNSIAEKSSVLITGSNASGKSTFIKTLAINAILAQTIYTATCRSYSGCYFMISSSMALRDNIFSKESYYMVEIKSLKRILDRVRDDIPTLCFIDEVLRGTNTLERVAASSRILSYLARKNTLVFAATHDIELTHILESDYSNYHFQERIEGNEIIFDYKLYQGKAVSKNAIKLLDMLKFPKEITNAAETAAVGFLKSGEWRQI